MSDIDKKRRKILESALSQFTQYGYRKTSMEDIAKSAGVSRPSVYSYFENKEEIFRNLAEMLFEDAFHCASTALTNRSDESCIMQRVTQALLAFNVNLFRLLDESPHGTELMDETGKLSGNIAQNYYTRFQKQIQSEIDHAVNAGELNLAKTGISSATAAETIRLSVTGLKYGSENANGYQKRIEQFTRVYFGGLA